jgi:hypothetical protein
LFDVIKKIILLPPLKNIRTMKKVLALLLVAGMFSFYACGPSAEEKAAQEKAMQDSIAAADAAMKAAEEAAAQQATADSMANASNMATDTTAKMGEKK